MIKQNIKSVNVSKLHDTYKLYFNKKNIKIGITDYNLKIYVNNKYILNKYLKLNTNVSKHCYTNFLCNKYKQIIKNL